MAYFESDDLADFEAYKKTRTDKLKLLGEKPVNFVFSTKHEFSKQKKTLPIWIFDKDKIKDDLVKGVKAEGSHAEGTCYIKKLGPKNEETLVFRVTKGSLDPKSFTMFSPVQLGEALDTGRADDDTPIDMAKSKLEQIQDMIKRQRKRLETATAARGDLGQKLADMKSAVVKLKTDADTREKNGEPAFKKSQEYLDATKSAAEGLREAAKAQTDNEAVIKLVTEMLSEVDAAHTPEEKAKVLFDEKRFGGPLKELEGSAYKAMKATDEALMVLGRTEDTWKLQMSQEQQPRALAVDPQWYSLTANDAFMKGGIDIKARFQLVTKFTDDTVRFLKTQPDLDGFMKYVNDTKEKEPALWNKNSGSPAVSAREIGQLLADGYWFGVYPKNPPKANEPDGGKPLELVQMMFPRALKPEVHKELLTAFAKMKAK